ncbi:hypothetical protein AVEN_77564-1 [Araneus ventricosus]|uniref:Uncharacterized protein n=1 Tax=Araneus ventricosus TaxID=182803 RepID=A0A4Y2I444_ARAVE|nr:hypothetical protein AVEN_77564-1 [Araneus ventricosus]
MWGDPNFCAKSEREISLSLLKSGGRGGLVHHEGYFGTDRNVEPRPDDEGGTRAGTPLKASAPYQQEGVWRLLMNYSTAGSIQGGTSVESSLEPGTFQSRNLTTRSPWSYG